jgi:hypothetical protein
LTIEVVQEVILARPDHLNRRVHPLRDLRRLGHPIHGIPPAERAAHERGVDGDSIERHLRQQRDHLLCPLRTLRRHPRLRCAVPHLHRAVHRLHRRVRLKWQRVRGVDPPCGAGQRRLRVTIIAHGFARLRDQLLELRVQRVAALGDVRTVIPLDLQRLTPANGRPGVLGHHRDAASRVHESRIGVDAPFRLQLVDCRDLEHVTHAGDLFRLRRVEAPRRAVDRRTPGDNREQHAGHTHVEAERRAPINLGWDVAANRRRAHNPQLLARLETHRLQIRHGQLCGGGNQLGERRAPAVAIVNNHSALDAAGQRVDLPRAGGGLDEHLARRRSRLAQRQP